MKPATPGNPSRCSWPTSTPPWTGSGRPWTSSPPTTPKTSPVVHNQLGTIYRQAGDTRQALRHYQQSITYEEARGDTCGAGQIRYNIALLLAGDGRRADALLYARAALQRLRERRPRRRPGTPLMPGTSSPASNTTEGNHL